MKYTPRQPREHVNYSSTGPLRETAVLVTGVLVAGAVFATVAALFIDQIALRVPPSWESRLLASIPVWEDGGKGKPQNPQQYLIENLLARLAGHWAENPYHLRVRVLHEDQPNALAFPGALILVTSGLLEIVESENELAFVLGHELGHFRNRDHLRHLGRSAVLGLLFAAIRGSTGGSSAVELLSLAGRLTCRKFSRGQEEGADAFGLELVHEEY
ncbi:MAG: M48 family metallopeptidase, partial [Acidobacteriota bacterium]